MSDLSFSAIPVQDLDVIAHMRWEEQQKFNEHLRKRLRSGWRNDDGVLNEYFDACALNWKLYTGERTPKQADKLYGIYKQALFGDCTVLKSSVENHPEQLRRWFEWDRLRGMPKDMAKRRYITYLSEINPSLINVLPNEAPPDGFPLDSDGVQICAKCNTVVGCSRPITDDHNVDLRNQLFEVEELHQPERLRQWVQNSIRKQRCLFGVHKPIARVDAKLFQDWFERHDNRGFVPYDNSPILTMVRDLLTFVFQVAYDIQLHKEEYTKDEFNEHAAKALKLKKYYNELTGEDFIFEVPCSRDIEVCNKRRITENGRNHSHPVEIEPPSVNYSTYEDALRLRQECQRIGADPCTGVVKDVHQRCEIYRKKIADRLAILKESQIAKKRNINRTNVHYDEKRAVSSLSSDVIQRQFIDAINGNNYTKVLSFTRKGRDPNVETPRGLTPLTCAIINQAPMEVVDELLQRKADPNHVNVFGITPLFLACRLRQAKLIHRLVNSGAIIDLKVPNAGCGNTVLHWCCLHGCDEEIKVLIETMTTGGQKDTARINRLLDMLNDEGSTALMLAAHRRNGTICRQLVELGASTVIRNKQGRNAAAVASSAGWKTLGSWITKKMGSGSLAKMQTYSDLQYDRNLVFSFAQVKDLIHRFGQTYLTLVQGSTTHAVHPIGPPSLAKTIVVENGREAAVKLQYISETHYQIFIQNDLRNLDKSRILHDSLLDVADHKAVEKPSALYEHLRESLQQILDIVREGHVASDVECPLKVIAWTPMMCAVVCNDVVSVRRLVREGADVDYSNCQGTTPLMLASLLQNIEVMVELLSTGASIDAVDNEGYTAMAYASTLPTPSDMEKTFFRIVTNGQTEPEKRLSAEDILRTAIKRGVGILKQLLMENKEATSDDAKIKFYENLGMLEDRGLSVVDSDWRLRQTMKASTWRLPSPPRSSVASQDGVDGARPMLAVASDLGEQTASQGSDTDSQARQPVRCPKCTLPIPCSHFYTMTRLTRFLKKQEEASKGIGEAAIPGLGLISGFEDPTGRFGKKPREVLDPNPLADIELDNRDTDRSLVLISTYRRHVRELRQLKQTSLQLDPGQATTNQIEATVDPHSISETGRPGRVNDLGADHVKDARGDRQEGVALRRGLGDLDSLSEGVSDTGTDATVGEDSEELPQEAEKPSDDVDVEENEVGQYSTADNTGDGDLSFAAISPRFDPEDTRIAIPKKSILKVHSNSLDMESALEKPSSKSKKKRDKKKAAVIAYDVQTALVPKRRVRFMTDLDTEVTIEADDKELVPSGEGDDKCTELPHDVTDTDASGHELSSLTVDTKEIVVYHPEIQKSEDIVAITDEIQRLDRQNRIAVAEARSLDSLNAGTSTALSTVRPNPVPPPKRGVIRFTNTAFDSNLRHNADVEVKFHVDGGPENSLPSPSSIAAESHMLKDKVIPTTSLPSSTDLGNPPKLQISGWLFLAFEPNTSSTSRFVPPISLLGISADSWGSVVDDVFDIFRAAWLPNLTLTPMNDVSSLTCLGGVRCTVCSIGYIRWKNIRMKESNADVSDPNDIQNLCLPCCLRRQLFIQIVNKIPKLLGDADHPFLRWPFMRPTSDYIRTRLDIKQSQLMISSGSVTAGSDVDMKSSFLPISDREFHNQQAIQTVPAADNHRAPGQITSTSPSHKYGNADRMTDDDRSLISDVTNQLEINSIEDDCPEESIRGAPCNELSVVPFSISNGDFVEAERLLRASLYSKSPREQEDQTFVIYQALSLQADMYKLMCLWPLALALYMDALDAISSVVGFDDIRSMRCVCLVTYCLTRLGLHERVADPMAQLTSQLSVHPRNPHRRAVLKKIEAFSRQQARARSRLDSIWVRIKDAASPTRDLSTQKFATFGTGGFVDILWASTGSLEGIKRGFLQYCVSTDGVKAGLIMQFLVHLCNVRVVDDEEVYRVSLARLIQKYLTECAPQIRMKRAIDIHRGLSKSKVEDVKSMKRLNDELLNIYKANTSAAERETVKEFLKFGGHLDLTLLDRTVTHCVALLRPWFKKYMLAKLRNVIIKNEMKPSLSLYLHVTVLMIQTRWRQYHAKHVARALAAIVP